MANEPSPVKAYIACSWFTPEQRAQLEQGLKAIEANPSVSREFSHFPLDHQYKGLDVNEHPELIHDVEWQNRTYVSDIEGMMGADLGIMLYNPAQIDDGVAYEMGYLRASGKQTVMVIPDDADEPLNLMVAIGVTCIIRMKELATFDFRHVTSGTYNGDVY